MRGTGGIFRMRFLFYNCHYLFHSTTNSDLFKTNPKFYSTFKLYYSIQLFAAFFLTAHAPPPPSPLYITLLHPFSPHCLGMLPELAKCRYSVEAAHTGILTPTCAHTAHGDATAPRPHSIQEDSAWHLPLPQITPAPSPRPSSALPIASRLVR